MDVHIWNTEGGFESYFCLTAYPCAKYIVAVNASIFIWKYGERIVEHNQQTMQRRFADINGPSLQLKYIVTLT